MTELAAKAISRWRYPAPYAFYDFDESIQDEIIVGLLNPNFYYYAIYEECDLVGFCCFGEDAQVPGGDYTLPNAIDIGLGMRPDLIGQGRGREFLSAILDFARQEYGATQFRATIAAFNQRSQKTFAQAGFQPVQRFVSHYDHITEFVVMLLLPQPLSA